MFKVALEKLGHRCVVSSQLIGKAVDALNGNESIRIRDTKLVVGLSNGGVVAQIRQSTACIQSFLLLTVLKLCGVDETYMGEIFYGLLCETADIRNTPVSVSQLRRLFGTISGHMSRLVETHGVDHLTKVISIFASLNAYEGLRQEARKIWFIPPDSSLKKLLPGVWEAINDDEVHHLVLKGSLSLVCVCVILTWLHGDRIAVLADQQCLYGKMNAKLRIQVWSDTLQQQNEPLESNWLLSKWKTGRSIPELIQTGRVTKDVKVRLSSLRIPAYSVYSYVKSTCQDDGMVHLIGGAIAAAASYSRIHVWFERDGHGHHSSNNYFADIALRARLPGNEVGLERLADDNVDEYMVDLGWPGPEEGHFNNTWLQIKARILEHKLLFPEDGFWACLLRHPSEQDLELLDTPRTKNLICSTASTLLLAPVLDCVAEDHVEQETQRRQLLRTLPVDVISDANLVTRMFKCSGERNLMISLRDLHFDIFNCVAPGKHKRVSANYENAILMISGEGKVIILAPLLTHSVHLKQIAKCFVVNGIIRYDQEQFDTLMNPWTSSLNPERLPLWRSRRLPKGWKLVTPLFTSQRYSTLSFRKTRLYSFRWCL